jgi:extracellular elastinolytic metalloproteinase
LGLPTERQTSLEELTNLGEWKVMKKMKRLLMAGGLAMMLLALILVLSGTATARNSGASAPNAGAANQLPGQFLTGPNAGHPLDIALNYIDQNRDSYGLTAADVAGLVVSDMYRSEHNGVTHIYLQQQKDGILVYNAYLNINIAADGSVINLGNRAVGDLDRAIEADAASLSAAEAVAAAADHLGLAITEPLVAQELVGGPERKVIFNEAGLSLHQIPVRLMYQPLDSGAVRLAWEVEIYELSTVDWWTMRVDAQTGEVLSQHNYIVHENLDDVSGAGHFDVHSGSAGQANLQGELVPESYRIFAIPKESPYDGSRTLELNPFDAIASPWGWHDTNGVSGAEYTITRGNNVFAYADTDANNVPDDPNVVPGAQPDGGAGLEFDFALDLSLDPLDYLTASVTNLFYMNNIMHDVTYQYGFNEVAGNFQTNNYGNGGLGNDAVNAEALDGSGTNNANFATPPDGSPGRMQMYRWTNPFGQLVTVNIPPSPPIGGPFVANPSNNGGTANGLTADVVIVIDGVAPTNDACETITNDLTGKIALIEWSAVCNSSVFVQNAANAGAVAAIIIDQLDPPLTNFGGAAAIPSVAVGNGDGMLIQNTIIGGATVNVTIDDNPAVEADRDSDMDNGIIAHEYGHGVSNRLTGGPNTTSCLGNAEQMGEGWSDFWTLVLSAIPSDTATLPRGIGNYSQFNDPDGDGIRLFPYTTDMSINPQTYDSIITNGTSPHSLGEVWMAMVWEVYWNLVDKYGFDEDFYTGTGGNNLTIQLVIDGMKLQPCAPGFVDGRNAILAADMALTGGQNQCEIWYGFAKRGLGLSADQGSPFSRTDGTEAFDLPAACAYLGATPPTQNICPGDSADYIVEVGQLFSAPVSLAANNVPAEATASFDPNPVTTVPSTATLTIDTTSDIADGSYNIEIEATDATTSTAVTVELVVDVCAVDYYMYLPMVFVPDANAQAAPEGQAGLPVNGLLLLPAMVGLGLVPYLRSRHQS